MKKTTNVMIPPIRTRKELTVSVGDRARDGRGSPMGISLGALALNNPMEPPLSCTEVCIKSCDRGVFCQGAKCALNAPGRDSGL